MTKIRHGKYILTPAQAENHLDAYEAQVETLKKVIAFVGAWSQQVLDAHQPYISGPLDLSSSPATDLHKAFAARLPKDLWCTTCSNPWPCRRITELRVLRKALRNGSGLTAAYAALKTFHKPENANSIPVHL